MTVYTQQTHLIFGNIFHRTENRVRRCWLAYIVQAIPYSLYGIAYTLQTQMWLFLFLVRSAVPAKSPRTKKRSTRKNVSKILKKRAQICNAFVIYSHTSMASATLHTWPGSREKKYPARPTRAVFRKSIQSFSSRNFPIAATKWDINYILYYII